MNESVSPRFILNAASLFKGGAVQASVAFILHAMRDAEVDWFFIVSTAIKKELKLLGEHLDEEKHFEVIVSPARSLSCRRRVIQYVNAVSPDAVFTFFGPAYLRFSQPHLLGVADGWVTHSTRLAYRKISGVFPKLKLFLRCVYNGWWYRQADEWVVEAECARRGLNSRFRVPLARIHVVANTCSDLYRALDEPLQVDMNLGASGVDEKWRVLTVSAYYPHKNLEMIPKVAHQLKFHLKRCEFLFQLTLDSASPEWEKIRLLSQAFDVADMIENIGPIALKDGPSRYRKASIVFLPSVLETFSANYPEAMASSRPIVTSDLSFARDVCGRAALYFAPDDAHEAAKQIIRLYDDERVYKLLVSFGRDELESLPDPKSKYQNYKKHMLKMLQRIN